MPTLSPPGAFHFKTLMPERCSKEATRLWESSLTCLFVCVYICNPSARSKSVTGSVEIRCAATA